MRLLEGGRKLKLRMLTRTHQRPVRQSRMLWGTLLVVISMWVPASLPSPVHAGSRPGTVGGGSGLGFVASWGANGQGQLGSGTGDRDVPTQIGLSNVAALAAGNGHSLALVLNSSQTGDVYAWGDNTFGQLGTDNSSASSPTPTKVAGLGDVWEVEAGADFSLAVVKQDSTTGTVWAWGHNNQGQLGNPTVTGDSAVPVQVLDPTPSNPTNPLIVQLPQYPNHSIAAGNDFAVAIKPDGTLVAWGNNNVGQLGNSGGSSTVPVPVTGMASVVDVEAGGEHALAATAIDPTSYSAVYAWGDNSDGQLGTGSTDASSSTPTQVTGLSNPYEISAGSNHCLALDDNGVEAWGDNSLGQLGVGSGTTTSNTPVPVSGLSAATGISAGGNESFAFAANGVWAWGDNSQGQLGTGTTISPSSPTLIADSQGMTTIASDGGHTLAEVQGGYLPVSIAAGWDLLDVPTQGGPATLSQFEASMVAPGNLPPGSITAAASYANGRFNVYVPNYSADVPLSPTSGVFVLSTDQVTTPVPEWWPSGDPPTTSSGVALQPGWNLVGASFPLAGMLTTAIASQASACGVAEIATYGSGGYTTWTPGQPGVQVAATQGMWIECSSAATWYPDPHGSAPTAPGNLQTWSMDSGTIGVSWSDTSDNESGFQILEGTTVVATVPAGVISYQVTGLQSQSQHCYTVIAQSQGYGVSSPSSSSCATTSLYSAGASLDPTLSPGPSSTATNILTQTTTQLPSSWDLSQWAPPVADQGKVDACASWATAYYLRYWLDAHSGKSPSPFAPMFVYSQLVHGHNIPTAVQDNLKIEEQQGVDTQTDYWQGNYDYLDRPTAAEKANAANYPIGDYTLLFSGQGTTPNLADVIRSQIVNDRPVILVIPIYANLYTASSSNPLVDVPSDPTKILGYHAVFAPKYDANGVWVENSWGTSWGQNGWGELSWAFVTQYAGEGWTATAPGTPTKTDYTAQFSGYTAGQPPQDWDLRGAAPVQPTIQQVGGGGPASQVFSFPAVANRCWNRWALKRNYVVAAPYTVTAKLRFTDTSQDRAGITIGWKDATWTNVTIDIDAVQDIVEWGSSSSLGTNYATSTPNPVGPISANTDYWLRVSTSILPSGAGEVDVSWSADGAAYTLVLQAIGASLGGDALTGQLGLTTAGPQLPGVSFESFQVTADQPSPPTYTLSGTVVDNTGAGVSGATVALQYGSTSAQLGTATTDPNGSYAIRTSTGTYSVVITPPAGSGLAATTLASQSLTGNTTVNVTLQPVANSLLHGRLLDPQGNPIPGQEIDLLPSVGAGGTALASASTDAAGNYALQVGPGSYGIRIQPAGTNPPGSNAPQAYLIYAASAITLNQDTTMNFVLPELRLTVHTQDSGGSPVAGATVQTSGSYPNSFTMAGLTWEPSTALQTNTTDASGNAAFWVFSALYAITVTPPFSGSACACAAVTGFGVSSDVTETVTLSLA